MQKTKATKPSAVFQKREFQISPGATREVGAWLVRAIKTDQEFSTVIIQSICTQPKKSTPEWFHLTRKYSIRYFSVIRLDRERCRVSKLFFGISKKI
jgi:hypothetical protein